MPLTEAEQGLLLAKREEAEQAARKRRKKRIAGLVSTAILLTGGAFGLNRTLTSETSPDNSPDMTTSTPANPTETESTKTEWGASAAELNDIEQLAQTFHSQEAAFFAAGVDRSNSDNPRQFEIGQDEYIDEISAPIDKAFLDAWFVPGWENNPVLAAKAANWIDVAHQTRDMRLRTNSPEDEEQFTQANIPTSITESKQDPYVVHSEWQCTMNTDKNRAVELFPDLIRACCSGSYTITFVPVDGRAKVANITK